MRILTLSLVLLIELPAWVTACATGDPMAPGAGRTIVLEPGFAPHPFTVWDVVSEPVTTTRPPPIRRDPRRPAGLRSPPTPPAVCPIDVCALRSAHLGQGCRGIDPSETPALTFQLTTELPDLLVRIDSAEERSCHGSPSILLAFPDGEIHCPAQDSSFYEKAWPKGTYQLYAIDPLPGALFNVRFEQPSRSQEEARQAIAAVPTYDVWPGAPTNPQFVSASGKTSITAKAAGLEDCLEKNPYVQPLVKLKLKEDMTGLVVRSLDSPLVIQPEDARAGPCKRAYAWGGAVSLVAGIYTVYAVQEKPAARTNDVIEIDDPMRPITLARSVEPTPISDLTRPRVIHGQVRKPGPVPYRYMNCHMRTRLDPDLYLASREPLTQVTLRLLGSETHQRLCVLGPLETQGHEQNMLYPSDHERPELRLEVFEGTYAVWVGIPEGEGDEGVGRDFHLVLTNPKTQADPFTALVEPAAELTIAGRILSNYYPFLDTAPERTRSFRLFTEVPDRLFVYARVDLDPLPGEQGDEQTIEKPIKDEPLLVHQSNREWTEVETYEGALISVPTSLLTATRPAQIHFRATPRPVGSQSLDQAIQLSAPEDQGRIAQHLTLERKFTACFRRRMDAHDPSHGERFAGRDFGRDPAIALAEATTENVAKQAKAACGVKDVERSKAALGKLLAHHLEKHLAEQLQAVKKRFGL